MSSPDAPRWSVFRIALWAAVALVVSMWLGPRFVEAFRPPDDRLTDFIQEWLSAKNYWAGTPVYADQTEALLRHTGRTPDAGEYMLPWNAHPPASILLAVPFGRFPYQDAQLAWNLTTFAISLLAVVVVVRELGLPYHFWSICPTIALVLVCHPLYVQLLQGQLNLALLPLLVFAWVAARRGRFAWAGGLIGAAAAFKLFPAFLFLYLFANRRWSALLAGALVFIGLNGVALALFGIGSFETYVREVVPSVAGYQTNWRNVSISGFWLRLFDPRDREYIVPLIRSPIAGRVVANVLRLLVVLAVARACWRANSGAALDRAFALALVAMLLISPVSWAHYFLLLVVPIAHVWRRSTSILARWAMSAVFALMWLPDNFMVLLVMGKERAAALGHDRHPPVPPIDNLVAISPPHYALVGLFLLTLLLPVERDAPREPGSRESPAQKTRDDESDEERLNRRLFGEPADG